MKIGRNDPCPCGSGKKYKKCCMKLEKLGGGGQADAVRSGGAGAVRRAAKKAGEWQADVVPVSIGIESDPTSRPCVVLVTAGGFVLYNDLLDRPAPEPGAVAEHLARGLASAVERVEAAPGAVRVRRRDVADTLEARLGRGEGGDRLAGIPVRTGDLEELDHAAFSLREEMGGMRMNYLSCRTETWAGWDLPEETVARVFSSAAEFFRASPWRLLANLDLLEARVGDEGPEDAESRTWSVGIMGMGREEYGIALYSEAADFWRLVGRHGGDPANAFRGLAGEVVSLTFDPGHRVPRTMRREVSRAGWEVAGPDAYPSVITINTLAGGLSRSHAEDLAGILEAVPRFLDQHAQSVERGRPVQPWEDRATGVTLRYRAEAAEGVVPGGTAAVTFPGPVDLLTTGFAAGPGAEPEAILEELAGAEEDLSRLEGELDLVDRFAVHLAEAAGFKEETVDRHGSNADLFVQFLVDHHGVPVRAVHEYHLRVFLFDWFPRKVVMPETEARSVPVSLKRFFEFLELDGISCPWATTILADRKTFEERWESCPGHFDWDGDIVLWRVEHDRDLMARAMLPDDQLGEDDTWGQTMGPTEARLMAELHARWLVWRDEEIRAGRMFPDELQEALCDRQFAWECAPQPSLGGKSPYQAIREEREETARMLER